MFFKVLLFTAILAVGSAQHRYASNQYASYNGNPNPIQHIAIAPAITAPIYRNPVQAKVAIPVLANYAAPSASSYFSPPSAPAYAAQVAHSPAVAHYSAAPAYAAPVPTVSSPAVAQYSAAPSYAAPLPTVSSPTVAHYSAAPVPTVSSPGVVQYSAAPSAAPVHHQEEFAHPKYEYGYSIEDHHTGDLHSQQEQRDGDHVVGQYTLHEADGTVRIVRYYDDGHGFNAVVERQGTPTEAPVIKQVPVAAAAPNHYH